MNCLLVSPMSLANGGSHGWVCLAALAALGSGGGIMAGPGLNPWGGDLGLPTGLIGGVTGVADSIGGGPGIRGGMGATAGITGSLGPVRWAAMRSLKSSGAGATGTSSGDALRVRARSALRDRRRRVEPETFFFPLDLERFGIFFLCSQLLGL
ncbi:TPA: hypothetical protein EYO57_18905 [Candidatus Poribacteria bacterium]|nr:hypothetical protein [Candidatus Poribacteria bacterium]